MYIYTVSVGSLDSNLSSVTSHFVRHTLCAAPLVYQIGPLNRVTVSIELIYLIVHPQITEGKCKRVIALATVCVARLTRQHRIQL